MKDKNKSSHIEADSSLLADTGMITSATSKQAVVNFSENIYILHKDIVAANAAADDRRKKTRERLGKIRTKGISDVLLHEEKRNFDVNSYGWTLVKERGKENKIDEEKLLIGNRPNADMWHYCNGAGKSLEGEQLFTYEAALREINKLGKKMAPSAQYYVDLIQKKYRGDCKRFLEEERIPLCGQRNDRKGWVQDMGGEGEINGCAYLWCQDGSYLQCYTYGYSIGRASDSDTARKNGMSVRCVED